LYHLSERVEQYSCLCNCVDAVDIDDRLQFQHLKEALTKMDITLEQQQQIFSILSSILHLQNLTFNDNQDTATVADSAVTVDHLHHLLS
jgi:myosin heavy subunit